MASLKLNLGLNAGMKESIENDIIPLTGKDISIVDLLVFTTEHNCSDLYITVGEQPYISRYGKITRLPCNTITMNIWNYFYNSKISSELNQTYVHEKLLDTSVLVMIPNSSPNYGKYPGNVYRYRASFGFSMERNTATFRMIKPDQPTFDTINYDPICIEALKIAYSKPSGICYTTGPTGSGKSTTMAASINSFTQPGGVLDNKVFITLEDPIENIFSNTDSVRISQKELGKDFKTFALGIKASLREHPNIIIVGECRDKEVICAAIESARTGHLTSTTFHSSSVAGALNRLTYHLENDKNLCLDLLLQLNIILAQKMLKQDGKYLVDTQFLLFTDEITGYLVSRLDDPNVNLPLEIESLIKNPDNQAKGWSKDWSYEYLHNAA